MAAARRSDEMLSHPASVPNPDPTQRTIEALIREISRVEQLFDSKFKEYDKAIKLLQDNANKSPSIDVVASSVVALEKVVNERFKGIDTQFLERDTRTAQVLTQGQTALIAALAAAKELVAQYNASSALAIAKNEMTTSDQIKQMVLTFGETTKGLVERIDGAVRAIDGKIDAAKDRISQLEGRGVGIASLAQGRHETWSSLNTAITLGLVLMTTAIGVLAFIMKA